MKRQETTRRRTETRAPADPFDAVRTVGLALPDVESVTKYDGSPVLKVGGKGFWPFHQVLLNGKPIETKFVSRNELQAMVPADAVKDVGMYKVTVKSSGEVIAESSPAPLVVKFKQ